MKKYDNFWWTTYSNISLTKNQLVLTFDNKKIKKFMQGGFCPPPASFPTFHSMNFHGMVTSSNYIGVGTSPFPPLAMYSTIYIFTLYNT